MKDRKQQMRKHLLFSCEEAALCTLSCFSIEIELELSICLRWSKFCFTGYLLFLVFMQH